MTAVHQLLAQIDKMHHAFGVVAHLECGQCAHCVNEPRTYSGRGRVNRYQCLRSSRSAWRTSWPACGLFRTGPAESYDDRQVMAVYLSWRCCRRTVYATAPEHPCHT